MLNLLTGFIGKAEAALNQVSFNGTDLVKGRVGDLNDLVHDGAAQLGAAIQKSDPVSNMFFNLDVSLDTSLGSIVVQFRRDYDPPVKPTNVQVKNVYPLGNLVTWSPSGTSSRPVQRYDVRRMDFVWQGGPGCSAAARRRAA